MDLAGRAQVLRLVSIDTLLKLFPSLGSTHLGTVLGSPASVKVSTLTNSQSTEVPVILLAIGSEMPLILLAIESEMPLILLAIGSGATNPASYWLRCH